jgi:CheY-like chemotaxis protein
MPATFRRNTPPAILVVEDQEDVRLMLTTVLQMEGYRVEEAPNAVAGLESLRRQSFDLVLTDYAMPGGTGTWMLHEAAVDGCLDGTASVVVTAHPELVRASTGFTVVGKPIDLDRFLEQVRRILKRSGRTARWGARAPLPAKIELVLYVSAASPASAQAQAHIERVLSMFNPDDIAFSVCLLQENPKTAEHDRVVFTPTLVKRYPAPRLWIIGDLSDGEVVAELVKASGVSPIR